MSEYENIIAFIASTNLVLTLFTLWATRSKAAAKRIDDLEDRVRGKLEAHDEALLHLQKVLATTPTQERLVRIEDNLTTLTRLSNNLEGQLEQMNSNLRLMLNNMVNHK